MRGYQRLLTSAHEAVALRGTGRTTKAMAALPPDSIYIVSQTGHHQKIRDTLNRPDIRIIGMHILDNGVEPWRGTDREVHVDHAIELTPGEAERFRAHNLTVQARRSKK